MRAIVAAVSPSMFSSVEYCSAATSKRDSSSRLDSTLYFLNSATVLLSIIAGSASGVVRRFSRPRFSASVCHASA